MTKSIAVIIAILFLSVISCKDFSLVERFYGITIRNNSEIKIYVYPCNEFADFFYPDTLLPVNKINPYLLEVGHHYYWESRDNYYEQISKLPADTLTIFFFNAEVYEDSAWSVIQENYLILDRYDLSIEDLNQMNYVINYP